MAFGSFPAWGLTPHLLHDIAAGSSDPRLVRGTTTDDLQVAYFIAPSGDLRSLWRTDGTVEGTRRLTSLDVAVFVTLPAGGVVFTSDTEERGYELYFSDGISAEATELAEFVAGPSDGVGFIWLNHFQGRAVVRTSNGRIWAVSEDGSRELLFDKQSYAFGMGTHFGIAITINEPNPYLFGGPFGLDTPIQLSSADPPWVSPHLATASGSTHCVKALASDQPHGILHCYDPAAGVVRRIIPPETNTPVQLFDDQSFTQFGDRLMFSGIGSSDVWVTDGTSGGTYRPWPGKSLSGLAIANGNLVFYVSAEKVWSSRGERGDSIPIFDADAEYPGGGCSYSSSQTTNVRNSAAMWKNLAFVPHRKRWLLTDATAQGTAALFDPLLNTNCGSGVVVGSTLIFVGALDLPGRPAILALGPIEVFSGDFE